jgi:hypothetical protein
MPKANEQFSEKAHLSMLPETQAIIRKFYAPFNAELANLLNNTDYLWDDK